MTDRYVHAIWCDDIRLEVGNKPSFMGVFTGGILLPALPTVLPRLAVYIWVNTPVERPFKSLRISITRDDGFLLMEARPPQAQTDDAQRSSLPDSTRQVAMAGFSLGGVEVPVGCKYFSILVETESETLEGPKLHINVNPQGFAEAFRGVVGGTASNAESPHSESVQD